MPAGAAECVGRALKAERNSGRGEHCKMPGKSLSGPRPCPNLGWKAGRMKGDLNKKETIVSKRKVTSPGNHG